MKHIFLTRKRKAASFSTDFLFLHFVQVVSSFQWEQGVFSILPYFVQFTEKKFLEMAECSAEKQPSISSDGAQIFPFKVLLSYLVERIYIKRLSIITENKGIVSPDSSPQTPQQNVVVDRKKTSTNLENYLWLVDFSVPTDFWVETVSTLAYVINR